MSCLIFHRHTLKGTWAIDNNVLWRTPYSTLSAIIHNSGMDVCQIIGRNIRKTRQRQNLSQDELAHRAGIDRSYLSEIENARTNVSVTVLASIAPALKVKIADLFAGYK